MPPSHSDLPEEDEGGLEPLPNLRTDQARASAQLVRWSFICSVPTLILFGLSVAARIVRLLNPGPGHEPLLGAWAGCFFVLALPTAPFSLLFGIFDIFRKPYVLLWLVPMAAYWGLSLVDPLFVPARQ